MNEQTQIELNLDPKDFAPAKIVLKLTGMSSAKLWRKRAPWQEARIPGRLRFAFNQLNPRVPLYYLPDLKVIVPPAAADPAKARPGRKKKIFGRCEDAQLGRRIAAAVRGQRELAMAGA